MRPFKYLTQNIESFKKYKIEHPVSIEAVKAESTEKFHFHHFWHLFYMVAYM